MKKQTFLIKKKGTDLYVYESFDMRNDRSILTLAEKEDSGGGSYYIHAIVFTDKKINKLPSNLRGIVTTKLENGQYVKEYIETSFDGTFKAVEQDNIETDDLNCVKEN